MDIPSEAQSDIAALNMGQMLSESKLEGGLASYTSRLNLEHGSAILKRLPETPPRLYELEARGRDALRVAGGPVIPRVYAFGPKHLLLEDLGDGRPNSSVMAEFGRRVATLHSVTNDRFGFHEDSYLGYLPVENTWSDDGHEFFARTRMLRFLSEPKSEKWLDAEDRRRVESIARRLPNLIPHQPPSLLHGDLWTSNMLVTKQSEPALIDPSVYFGWPEADLSMTFQYSPMEPDFFAGYFEINRLDPGWEDRFEILNLRELLSMVAHCGNDYGTVPKLRAVLAQFS